ncbi:MAG: hypothetical protein HY099_03015, partial [Nitrospirae bacterium]|nr:hypothetical protein [Nitrospirota bacterium]
QSVKSLRGERMEEVIFQGSATVKQKGMAEVTMLLSQSEKSSPENGNGASSEDRAPNDRIIVSRRLYRSGESEYLLNKSQCRLKDIRDIFLDTGLDVKSYSILDQGKVSEIINTKPNDRRFLIEEVAGVMKYKVRKTEALSKLESSKQNLQRINDIVYEVKRQINSLDRQVKKAERYKRLIEELKGIELRIAKREHIRLSELLNSLLSVVESLKEIDSSKRSELSTLENQIETKRLELIDKEKSLAELEGSLYAKEREISESEKHIAVLKTGMENTKSDISRLTNQQNEFDIKREGFLKKIEEINNNMGSISSSMAGLSDELREKRDSLSDIEMSIAEKESEIEDKRKELFRISENISHKKNDLHKLQSSLETLKYRESASAKDMETIKEGIGILENAIKEAEDRIKAANDRHAALKSERDGLLAVTERLGGEIENKKALLASEREALASNISRLNSLRELTVDRSLMDVMSESGRKMSFSGSVLSDIINADKDYEKAIEAALSEKTNSIILSSVEDILTAVDVIKDKHLGRTALLYTAFSANRPDSATIHQQQSLIGGIENELNTMTSSLTSRKESLRTLENSLVETEKEFSIAGHSLESQKEDLERKKRKLSFLDTELATIAGEKESLKTLIDTKTEEITLIERERNALNEGIITVQNSLASIKAEYEEARSHLTDMQLAVASYKEKSEALQREHASVGHAVRELERNKQASAQEIQEAERKLAESLSELRKVEETIKTFVAGVDMMRQERASKKEALETENQALVSENAALKNIRTEIDMISQELSEANSKAVENRLRVENIESSVAQKYGLDIKKEEIGTEGFDPTEDEDRVNQLNEKIRDLGPVNLGTIEEYEELKNRYDFLTKQQQDLTLSIAELEEAISRINTSTRRKLREAYDALRAKFSEVFTALFGGGKADIILTDEENILESGIDIIVQPPGKKLQNINLLSGGEKALTSLSLLFAGFLIKPSPLCILDEVDAPLDESNTARFAQMIKELSKDTQFIVITHNRTTMEVADYLYGITMEEPGVSKAISLQFAELEKMN